MTDEAKAKLKRIEQYYQRRLEEMEKAGVLSPANPEARGLAEAGRIIHRLLFGDVPAILRKDRWA